LHFGDDGNWTYADTNVQSEIIYQSGISLPFSAYGKAWFTGTADSYWNIAATSGTGISIRQEKPRIKNDALVSAGDLSSYDSLNNFKFTSTSAYLEYSNFNINLSNAAPDDTLSLAFSIANAVASPTAVPTDYCIMLQFVSNKPGGGRAEIKFTNSKNSVKTPFMYDYAGQSNDTYVPVLPANRYLVLEKKVSNIVYIDGSENSSSTPSSSWSWGDVSTLRVFSSIQTGGTNVVASTPTAEYAIVLDGFRYNNTVSQNPLYALTGYTTISNSTASKLVKDANTNSLINFRISLSLGG
jgi:hypothetical protein